MLFEVASRDERAPRIILEAPALAKLSAVDSPMPLLAPEMKTLLPARFCFVGSMAGYVVSWTVAVTVKSPGGVSGGCCVVGQEGLGYFHTYLALRWGWGCRVVEALFYDGFDWKVVFRFVFV
jgi:hypothetical protein